MLTDNLLFLDIHSMRDKPGKESAITSTEAIAHYYNANNSRFLKLGGSGESAAIHRAIWAPGVEGRMQAFLYLNQLIADALKPILGDAPSSVHVLDLGCGVGGTATWLAQSLGVVVTGVTLSTEQVQVAQSRTQQLGLEGQVNFVLGDFCSVPDLPLVQAAWAIESFVHASDARDFFAMAARQIRPGGRLIICDDFLNPPHGMQARRWIKRFANGWHLNNLLPVQTVMDTATEAGFRLVEERDLSPWIRSFHPLILWLVTTATRLPLPWAYWQNLSGGTSLQVCLKKRWTVYRAIVWERL